MISFKQKVWKLVKKVPKGKITTYKEIAKALHCKAYQAVGQALAKSPGMPLVPCHRVIKSDGSIGGFNNQTSGPQIKRKIKLLKKEGVIFKKNKMQNFNTLLISFD